MSEQDRGSVTRRAFARLLVSGAAGLSLLSGSGCTPITGTCYKTVQPPQPAAAGGGTSLQRWAYLGEIWRKMTSHWKKPRKTDEPGNPEFEALRVDMLTALDGVDASAELRAVFAERWYHINRSHYSMTTCYEMMMGGMPVARGIVEDQVAELGKLVEEGKLTEEAGRKSAEVLGVQAEFMARYREAMEAQGDGGPWPPIVKAYDDGEIVAGEEAELAGERLVELTVDKLGWLAGPVPDDDENAEGETDE